MRPTTITTTTMNSAKKDYAPFIQESSPLMKTPSCQSTVVSVSAHEVLLAIGNQLILRYNLFTEHFGQRVIALNKACRGFVPNCVTYNSVTDLIAFVYDRSSNNVCISIKGLQEDFTELEYEIKDESILKFVCVRFRESGEQVGAIVMTRSNKNKNCMEYKLLVWRLSTERSVCINAKLVHSINLGSDKGAPQVIYFHPKMLEKILILYEKSQHVSVVFVKITMSGLFLDRCDLAIGSNQKSDHQSDEMPSVTSAMWGINEALVIGDSSGVAHIFQQCTINTALPMKFAEPYTVQPSGDLKGIPIICLLFLQESCAILFETGVIHYYSFRKLCTKSSFLAQNKIFDCKFNISYSGSTCLTPCCKYLVVADEKGQKIHRIKMEEFYLDLIHDGANIESDDLFINCDHHLVAFQSHITMQNTEVFISAHKNGDIRAWHMSNMSMPLKTLTSVATGNVSSELTSVLVLRGTPFIAVGEACGKLSLLIVKSTQSSLEKSFEINAFVEYGIYANPIDLLSFEKRSLLLAVSSTVSGGIIVINMNATFEINNIIQSSCSFDFSSTSNQIKSINWLTTQDKYQILLVSFTNGNILSFNIELNQNGSPIASKLMSGALSAVPGISSIICNNSIGYESIYISSKKIKGFEVFHYPSKSIIKKYLEPTFSVTGGSKHGRSMIICERAEVLIVGTESGELLVFKIFRDTTVCPQIMQVVSVHSKPIISLSCNAEGSILYSLCSDLIVAHNLDKNNIEHIRNVSSYLVDLVDKRLDIDDRKIDNKPFENIFSLIQSAEKLRSLNEVKDKRRNIARTLESIKQRLSAIIEENKNKSENEQLNEIVIDRTRVSELVAEIDVETKRLKESHILNQIRNNIESIRLRIHFWDSQVVNLNYLKYFKQADMDAVASIPLDKLKGVIAVESCDTTSCLSPTSNTDCDIKWRSIILDKEGMIGQWSFAATKNHSSKVSDLSMPIYYDSRYVDNTHRRSYQAKVMSNVVYEIIQNFHCLFKQTRQVKLDSMAKIDSKKKRVKELSEDLNANFNFEALVLDRIELLHVDALFNVNDSELSKTVREWKKQENDTLKRRDASARCLNQDKNQRNREVLFEMMNGQLNLNKSVLNPSTHLIKEEWMETLHYEDMSREQKKVYDDFMQQLNQAEEGYNKQRLRLEQEIETLKLEIRIIENEFDMQLKDLSQQRFCLSTTIATDMVYLAQLEQDLAEREFIQEQIRIIDTKLKDMYDTRSMFSANMDDAMANISRLNTQINICKDECKSVDKNCKQIMTQISTNKSDRLVLKELIILDPFINSDENKVKDLVINDIPGEISVNADTLKALNCVRITRLKRQKELNDLLVQKYATEDAKSCINKDNGCNDKNILGLEEESNMLKSRIDLLDRTKRIVVRVTRGQNEVDNTIDVPAYQISGIVPMQKVQDYNFRLRTLGDQQILILKKIQTLRDENRKLCWENELLDLKIATSREKHTDIQLLRLTGLLKSTIFSETGEARNSACSREADMTLAITKLSHNHSKTKAQLTKARDNLIRKVKEMLTENTSIAIQQDTLRSDVVEAESMYEVHRPAEKTSKMNHLKMRNITTRSKLIDVCRNQLKEIKLLRKELDKNLQRTFPMFA